MKNTEEILSYCAAKWQTRDELAGMIIRGELVDGGKVSVDSDGENLIFKA